MRVKRQRHRRLARQMILRVAWLPSLVSGLYLYLYAINKCKCERLARGRLRTAHTVFSKRLTIFSLRVDGPAGSQRARSVVARDLAGRDARRSTSDGARDRVACAQVLPGETRVRLVRDDAALLCAALLCCPGSDSFSAQEKAPPREASVSRRCAAPGDGARKARYCTRWCSEGKEHCSTATPALHLPNTRALTLLKAFGWHEQKEACVRKLSPAFMLAVGESLNAIHFHIYILHS